MSAQSVSIASMFGWVVDTFKLVRKNFSSLIGASSLTLGLGLLMCLPMWFVMFAGMKQRMQSGGMTPAPFPMGGDLTMVIVAYAITIIIGLLLFPPLLVGWLRLCRDIDRNAAVRALDIFKPYRDSQLWLRSIYFALLAFLIYVLIFGVFGLVFSGVIAGFMHDIAAQQAATLAGAPPPPPHFAAGFFLAYFCFLGVAMLLQFVYFVGFAEIALRPTPIVEALKLAVVGLLKNLLKLIVFVIGLFMGFMLLTFAFALIVAVVVALASLISPMLGLLAVVLVYIPFLLCIYPLMFAGFYFAWKSILGGDDLSAPDGDESTVSV